MFAPFFTPIIGQDKNIAELLFKEFYTSSRERVMQQLEDSNMPQQANAFSEQIQQASNEAYWCAELGFANELLNTRSDSLSLAAAQIRLIDLALGDNTSFSMPTPTDEKLYLDGIPITTGKQLEVECKDDTFTLKIDKLLTEFKRQGNRIEPISPINKHRYIKNDVIYLNQTARDSALLLESDVDLPNEKFQALREQIFEAMTLIGEVSPEYQKWTHRVLRNINCVDVMTNDRTSTRSTHLRPGSIVLSPTNTFAQAENLVHECTHQYFYLCCLLTKIAKPTQGKAPTFYSPIVDAQRNIKKILLSYHATANIVIFHDLLNDHLDKKEDFVTQRITTMCAIAKDNYHVLTQNAHMLTDQANQMWQVANQHMELLFQKYL